MAVLNYNFGELYAEVGERLKNDRAPTGDDLVEAKRLVNAGYARFLNAHSWSFMYPTATLSVTADTTETVLPADFGEMLGDFRYATDAGYGLVHPSTVEYIKSRRAIGDADSHPSLYAIEPVVFVPATGQRWQVLFWPTPDAAYTLNYSYRVQAAEMTADAEFPHGGQAHGETILQAALMVHEQRNSSMIGPQTIIYQGADGRGGMLAESIRRDARNKPSNLGRGAIPSVHRTVDTRIQRNTVEKV